MDCNVGKLENARFTFALWLGFLWNSAKNIFHFSFPMLSTILVFMLMFSWPKRFYSIHWGNMSGRFYSFGVPYKLLGGERYSYQSVLPGQHEDSKLHLSESNLEKRQQHSKPCSSNHEIWIFLAAYSPVCADVTSLKMTKGIYATLPKRNNLPPRALLNTRTRLGEINILKASRISRLDQK